MAQESSFSDMLLNSLKDAFDQLTSDVGKGDIGKVYEQVTRGPTPLGRLPVRGAVQAVAPKLNDLLSMVLDMAPQASSASGILGPIGRTASKSYNQAQKKILKSTFKSDPQTLQDVVADPRMLQVLTPQGKGGTAAMLRAGYPESAMASYRGSSTMPTGQMTFPPTTLRGMTPTGEIVGKSQPLGQTATHEATHFLTGGRGIYDLPEEDISLMTAALMPYIKPWAQRAAVRGAKETGVPGVALDEAIAYLSGAGTRAPGREVAAKQIFENLRKGPLTPQRISDVTKEASKGEDAGLLNYIMSVLGGK